MGWGGLFASVLGVMLGTDEKILSGSSTIVQFKYFDLLIHFQLL